METILVSYLPFFSKWWWSGDIRKIRFFVFLKYSTCNITETVDKTNINPMRGIYKLNPLKIARQLNNAPKASDPVSPIKMLAGWLLKQINPNKAPKEQHIIIIKLVCSLINTSLRPCVKLDKYIKLITPKPIKYAMLTPPARPSSPSVRLTLFVAAINTSITKGIIPQLRSSWILVKGK